MSPVDVTISLYDGLVTDYPFDHHKAYLEMYLEGVTKEKKEGGKENGKADAAPPAPNPVPAATPAAQGEEDDDQPERQHADAAPKTEAPAEDNSIPIGVDFFGSIPGMDIKAAKTAQTDDDFVGIDMEFGRSSTVKFFAIFVMAVMWGVTVVVLLMTFAIVMRERKVEVGMFSFLAALIFSFVTVRNAQPGSPPIGSYSDYISFFWAIIIIALCLLTIVAVWVFRPASK
jgi:cation transport ATPase